jgi:hypothetical protein
MPAAVTNKGPPAELHAQTMPGIVYCKGGSEDTWHKNGVKKPCT